MEAIGKGQELLTDTEIIHRILGGDKKLYEQIIRKYNPRLYRIGMSVVNEDMEVEELMQVAYIKAYEHLQQFEHRSSFATWLTRIFLNECLQYVKRKKRVAHNRNQILSTVNSSEMRTPDSLLLNKELGKALEYALVRLPEKYRVVFVMREMEGMSIAETVAVLGISESNVKVRLNRARTMLRDTLSAFYKNDRIFSFHLVRCDRVSRHVMDFLA